MNVENFAHLKESLKYTGFGESLNKELEGQLRSGAPDFQLVHNAKIGNDDMSYRLHFRKDNVEDKYYFNKFDALLQPAGQQDKTFEQTFYSDQRITAKEAYNLLTYGEQTAVSKNLYNKDDQPYHAWVTIDLNGEKDKNNNYPVIKYHDNYYKKQPFEIQKSLKQLPVPVKEIDEGKYLDSLEKSLRRGNAVNVTIMHEGQEKSGVLLVNAKKGQVDVYDDKMQLIERQSQQIAAIKEQAPAVQQDDVKKKSSNDQQVNWTKNNNYRKGIHQ